MSRTFNVFAVGKERVYQLILQMNDDARQDLFCNLFEQGLIQGPAPSQIQNWIDLRKAKNEAEKAKREQVQDEIRKAHATPDYKFPTLFRRDPCNCLTYIHSLKTEEITKLLNGIQSEPRRWSSILDFRVADAIQTLQNELSQRQPTTQQTWTEKIAQRFKP